MAGPVDELAARAEARVGTLLAGKYRLERLLGVGGMAAVYAGTHRNGRRVAVKVLHPELAIRSDIRQRFLREGHAANAVDHTGVVAVIDDEVSDDGAAFLVMELLEGHSVEELWDRNGQRLPTEVVLAIGRELCDVLSAAHRVGVIHRDIKPANLFVTNDGQLKVLDFGIARVRESAAATQLTATGTALGTPAFMAPEQAGGRARAIDERTDIWAIGATMFMLLSGRVVHEGETPQHVIILSATKTARSLAVVAPDAPGVLIALVDRALALDQAARWPTAETMGDAIREVSKTLYGHESLPLVAASPCPIVAERQPSEVPGTAAVVGSTTSSAVSSGTDDVRTIRRHWPRLAPLGRTLSSAYACVRILVNASVGSRPVSNIAPTVLAVGRRDRSRTGRTALPLVLLGGVAILAVGMATRMLVADRRAGVIPDEARPSPPAEQTPASAEPSPAASVTPIVTSGVQAPADASSAAPTPNAPAVATDGPRRVGSATPPPRPAPRALTPASPRRSVPGRDGSHESSPPPRAPTCTTPYVIDSTGKKIWRPECL